jgi:hypothetical protein
MGSRSVCRPLAALVVLVVAVTVVAVEVAGVTVAGGAVAGGAVAVEFVAAVVMAGAAAAGVTGTAKVPPTVSGMVEGSEAKGGATESGMVEGSEARGGATESGAIEGGTTVGGATEGSRAAVAKGSAVVCIRIKPTCAREQGSVRHGQGSTSMQRGGRPLTVRAIQVAVSSGVSTTCHLKSLRKPFLPGPYLRACDKCSFSFLILNGITASWDGTTLSMKCAEPPRTGTYSG